VQQQRRLSGSETALRLRAAAISGRRGSRQPRAGCRSFKVPLSDSVLGCLSAAECRYLNASVQARAPQAAGSTGLV